MTVLLKDATSCGQVDCVEIAYVVFWWFDGRPMAACPDHYAKAVEIARALGCKLPAQLTEHGKMMHDAHDTLARVGGMEKVT